VNRPNQRSGGGGPVRHRRPRADQHHDPPTADHGHHRGRPWSYHWSADVSRGRADDASGDDDRIDKRLAEAAAAVNRLILDPRGQVAELRALVDGDLPVAQSKSV
jgi:hypothetical protein